MPKKEDASSSSVYHYKKDMVRIKPSLSLEPDQKLTAEQFAPNRWQRRRLKKMNESK